MKRNIEKTIIYLAIHFLLCINFLSCDTTEPAEGVNFHNKILFTSSRSGIPQLYIMNPDGTDIKQITSGEYSHSGGRWSPDAAKIVCNTSEHSTTAGNEMVLINLENNEKEYLGLGNQMSWYPDGSKIFFTYCPSCEVGIFEVYLCSIDIVSAIIKIESEKFVSTASFSPSGENICLIYNGLRIQKK